MNSTPKRICLLGSTGSIGQTTLKVVADHPDRFEIVGLSARHSCDLLYRQVERYAPVAACLAANDTPVPDSGSVRWFTGAEGLEQVIEASEPDLLVLAVVGAAGLRPMLKALDLGIPVALANKEVLVTAGELVMSRARKQGLAILPLDSEHNAIFQCLDSQAGRPDLRRVLLTASGGPFRGRSRAELERVTIDEALRHPTWAMGRKITIDSATMMNKGLEVIEGHHLFGVDADKFQIVVHPQSVVHSMVEFIDGSVLAQMGVTDMYFPIVHALSYPDRLENTRFPALDLFELGRLDFEPWDPEAFPCPAFAYEAVRQGGTWPTVLNAANEVAVELFLAGEIAFLDIPRLIDAALQSHDSREVDGLEAIEQADGWARAAVHELHRRASSVRSGATA